MLTRKSMDVDSLRVGPPWGLFVQCLSLFCSQASKEGRIMAQRERERLAQLHRLLLALMYIVRHNYRICPAGTKPYKLMCLCFFWCVSEDVCVCVCVCVCVSV